MTNKDETKCFIKCSDGKRIVTLRITEEYLVQEWNCGSDVARRHWNLKNLSPMPDYSQGRGKDFTLYGIITIAVLALSVCLFFSSLNRYVPLLSPFVGIAGLFLFYKTIEHGKVRKWTIFQIMMAEPQRISPIRDVVKKT